MEGTKNPFDTPIFGLDSQKTPGIKIVFRLILAFTVVRGPLPGWFFMIFQ